MKSKKKRIIALAIVIAVIATSAGIIYHRYQSERENEIKEIAKKAYMEKLNEIENEAYEGERAKEYGLSDLEYYISNIRKHDDMAYYVDVTISCHADKIDPNYEMEDTERELLADELTDWAQEYMYFDDEKYGEIWVGSESYYNTCFVNDKLSYSYNMLMEYENSYSTHTCEVCGKDATHSLEGLGGDTEWYCDTHWNEMKNMFNDMIDG